MRDLDLEKAPLFFKKLKAHPRSLKSQVASLKSVRRDFNKVKSWDQKRAQRKYKKEPWF